MHYIKEFTFVECYVVDRTMKIPYYTNYAVYLKYNNPKLQ